LKKISIYLISIFTFIASFSFGTNYAIADSDPLNIQAEAVFVFDFDTGVVLYEKNADELLGVASMSKMMTEYIVLEEIEKGTISWEQKVVIDAYVHNEGHQILLITRSVNFGDITEPTRQFLNQFVSHTVGVLVSDTEGVIDLVGVTDLVGVFVGSGVLELVGVALIVFVGVKVGVDVIGRLWGSLVPV
jgi:hypothetical protein